MIEEQKVPTFSEFLKSKVTETPKPDSITTDYFMQKYFGEEPMEEEETPGPVKPTGNFFESIGNNLQHQLGSVQKAIGQTAVDITGEGKFEQLDTDIKKGRIDVNNDFGQSLKQHQDWVDGLKEQGKDLESEYLKVTSGHFSEYVRGTDNATREKLVEANKDRALQKWPRYPEYQDYKKKLQEAESKLSDYNTLFKESHAKETPSPGGYFTMMPTPNTKEAAKTNQEVVKAVADRVTSKTLGESILDKGIANITDAAEAGEGKGGAWWKIGQAAGGLLPILGAVGASVAIPPAAPYINAALGAGYALQGSGSMMTAYEENQKELKKPIDPVDREMYGLAGGLAMAIPAWLGLGKLVSEQVVGKTIASTLLKGGFENGGRKVLVEFAEKNPAIAKRIINDMAHSGITGGNMMGSITGLNIAIENTFKEDKDKTGILEGIKQVAESYATGAISMSFLGPLKTLGVTQQQKEIRKRNGSVRLAINGETNGVFEVTGQDPNGNITGYTRDGKSVTVIPENVTTSITVPLDVFDNIIREAPKHKETALKLETEFYKQKVDENIDLIMKIASPEGDPVIKATVGKGKELQDVIVIGGDPSVDQVVTVMDGVGRRWQVGSKTLDNAKVKPAEQFAQELRQIQYQRIGYEQVDKGIKTGVLEPPTPEDGPPVPGTRGQWTDRNGAPQEVEVMSDQPDQHGNVRVKYESQGEELTAWISPVDIVSPEQVKIDQQESEAQQKEVEKTTAPGVNEEEIAKDTPVESTGVVYTLPSKGKKEVSLPSIPISNEENQINKVFNSKPTATLEALKKKYPRRTWRIVDQTENDPDAEARYVIIGKSTIKPTVEAPITENLKEPNAEEILPVEELPPPPPNLVNDGRGNLSPYPPVSEQGTADSGVVTAAPGVSPTPARDLLVNTAMDMAGFTDRKEAELYVDEMRKATGTQDNEDIGDPESHLESLREATNIIHRKNGGDQYLEVDLVAGKDVKSTIELLKKLKPQTDMDKEAVRQRLSVLEGYGEYIDELVGNSTPVPETEVPATPVEQKPAPQPQKEPWQMTRKDFISEKDIVPPQNKTDQPTPNKYNEGDRVIDIGPDPYVYEFRRIDPNSVDYSEKHQSVESVLQMPTTQKYIEWFKQGIEPPPITVVYGQDQKKLTSTDRRRILAARETGVKTIPAFVEIGKHQDIIRKALSEGKSIPPEVLAEYPDLQKANELPPLSASSTAIAYGNGHLSLPEAKQKINEALASLVLGKGFNQSFEEYLASNPKAKKRNDDLEAVKSFFATNPTPEQVRRILKKNNPEEKKTKPVLTTFVLDASNPVSKSGRNLTSVPKTKATSSRMANKQVKEWNQWLLDNTKEEVKGDDWKSQLVSRVKLSPKGDLAVADISMLNDLLFGEPNGVDIVYPESKGKPSQPAPEKPTDILSIPTKYKGKDTTLQVKQSPSGLYILYGNKKKWDKLSSDILNSQGKLNITGLNNGSYADITLSIPEAEKIIKSLDGKVNENSQRDINTIKDQLEILKKKQDQPTPKKKFAGDEVFKPEIREEPEPGTDDHRLWLSEQGTNADDIAIAYQEELANIPMNRLPEWQQELIQARNTRVSRTSFSRFGDPNWIGKSIVLNWLTKDPKDPSGSIDAMAEYYSELWHIEITPEDIVEFIRDNPSRYARKTTDLQKALERRYKQITGKSVKDHKFESSLTPEKQSVAVVLEHWQAEAIAENGITSIEILKGLKDELFTGFPYEPKDYERIEKFLDSQVPGKKSDTTPVESHGEDRRTGDEGPEVGGRSEEEIKPLPDFLTEDEPSELTPDQQSEIERKTTELKDKIKSKGEQLRDARSRLQSLKNKMEGRKVQQTDIFGTPKPFAGDVLFEVKKDFSQKNIQDAIRAIEGEIATYERELTDLITRKDKVIEEITEAAKSQGNLFVETTTDKSEPSEYRYKMDLRPFGIGTYPTEGFIRAEQDPEGGFQILVYSKKLTPKEISHWSFTPLTEIDQIRGMEFTDEDGYYDRIELKWYTNNRGADALLYDREGNLVEKMALSHREVFQNIESGYWKTKSKGGIRMDNQDEDIDFQIPELPYTQKEIDDVLANSKEVFGTTESFKTAGYLLPDGDMLQFGDGVVRGFDHRNISMAFYKEDGEGNEVKIFNPDKYFTDRHWMGSSSPNMFGFMQIGAIRIKPESNGLDIATKPTYEQRRAIRRFVAKHNGYVIIDFTKIENEYTGSKSVEYDEGTPVERVLNDIDNYFNNGVLPVAPDIHFRIGSLYSPTETALNSIQQGKGTIDQWKAMLLKNGAKGAELDWMGWDDLVTGKTSLTKAEIQEWIDQNKVEIQELTKSSENSTATVREVDGGWAMVYDDSGERMDNEIFDTYLEAAEYYDMDRVLNEDRDTKYHDYQLPGGEHYKEILLTMPVKLTSEEQELRMLNKKTWGPGVITAEETRRGAELQNKLQGSLARKLNNTFKSTHWDEQNILAHIRMNERTDAEGNKVLFIEEIQSDWAQKGKKEGFKQPVTELPSATVIHKNETGRYSISVAGIDMSVDFASELEARTFVLQTLNKAVAGIPNMPFKQTDQWVGLTLKRMITYAVDNGFDKIAWTTGEQQAERYDLSKQVENIGYQKRGDNFNVTVWDKNGKQVWQNQSATPEDVESNLGKEILRKMQNGEGNAPLPGKNLPTYLGGLDLKVGGEGMKAFYDNIVPSVAGKIGKKYGAKVEEINLTKKTFSFRKKNNGFYEISDPNGHIVMNNVDPEKIDQWKQTNIFVRALAITPALAERVSTTGLPMFRLGSPSKGRIPHEEVVSIYEDLDRKAPGAPKIIALKSVDELPKRIREHPNFNPQAKGVVSNDGIFAISSNLTSREDAIENWVHEVGAHHGLRSIFPDPKDYDDALKAVWYSANFHAKTNSDFRKIVNHINENYRYDKDPEVRKGNEFIAFLAQKITNEKDLNPAELSIWQKFINRIREILAKLFNFKAETLSVKDIEDITKASVKSNFHELPADQPARSRGTVPGERNILTPGERIFGGERNPVDGPRGNAAEVRPGGIFSEMGRTPGGNPRYGRTIPAGERIFGKNRGIDFRIVGPSVIDKSPVLSSRRDMAERMEWEKDITTGYWEKLSVPENAKVAKEIFLATGMQRGRDGQWRFDIPDTDFEVNLPANISNLLAIGIEPGESIKTNIAKIVNPKWGGFNDYPDLKNVDIVFENDPNNLFSAKLLSLQGKMQIRINRALPSGKTGGPGTDYPNPNISEGKSRNRKEYNREILRITLLHELQHAIQNKEGYFDSSMDINIPQSVIDYFGSIPSSEVISQLDHFSPGWQTRKTKLYKGILNNDPESLDDGRAIAAYFHNAQEAEAYNTEMRDRLSPTAREETPISETEKVPRERQWDREFDSENEDINFRIERVQNMSDGEFAEEFRDFIPTMRAVENKWFDKVVTKHIQDAGLAIKKLEQEIQRRGFKITMDKSPYFEQNRTAGSNRSQSEDFYNNYEVPLIETFGKIKQEDKVEFYEIEAYLKAKHGLERNKKMNEDADPGKEKIRGGIPKQMLIDRGLKKDGSNAQAIIQDISYDDLLEYLGETVRSTEKRMSGLNQEELWSRIHKATMFTLDRWWKDGFISLDHYLNLTGPNGYKNYVPLRGWKGDTTDMVFEYLNNDVGGAFNPNKKAFGRISEADDVVPYIFSMAGTAIVSGNKNAYKRMLLDLAREHKGLSDLVRIMYTYEVKQPDGTWVNVGTEKPDKELFDQKLARINKDTSLRQRNTKSNAGQHEVDVFEGGQRYTLLTDPQVAAAINGDNMRELGEVGKITGSFTRFWASWTTSKNPAFVIPNMARDFRFALRGMYVENNAKMMGQFMANYGPAHGAILRQLYGKQGKTPKQQDMDRKYQDFRMNGGITGYTRLEDIDRIKKKMEREAKWLMKEKNAKGTLTGDTPLIYLRRLFRLEDQLTSHLAEWSENIARFSTYLTHLDNGASIKEAATRAKESTTNFDRKGTWSSSVNAGWAFFNARVQGIKRYADLWKASPAKMAAFSAIDIALGFGLAALMDNWYGDDTDDENVKKYDKTNPFVRRNYLNVPVPGSDKLVSIPNPHSFAFFHSMGSTMYDVMTGRTTAAKALELSLDSFTSNLLPVDLGSSFSTEGRFTGRPFIPTFAVPIWDLVLNEDFAGRYIFREPFTKEMEERLSDSQMYKYGTNPLLVKMTNALYEATGGDIEKGMAYYYEDGKKKHAWGSINPSSVEHLLEGYLSGKGQFYNQTYKLVRRAVNPSPKDKPLQTYDIPIVSRFVRNAWGDPIKDEYYQKRKAASDILYEYKQGKKVSEREGNRVKREIGIPKYNLAVKVNNLQKQIDDVNEDLNSPKLSQTRKDQLMTRKRNLMKQINALDLE